MERIGDFISGIRYRKETEVVTFQGKEITLENLSPVFTPEQETVKRMNKISGKPLKTGTPKNAAVLGLGIVGVEQAEVLRDKEKRYCRNLIKFVFI